MGLELYVFGGPVMAARAGFRLAGRWQHPGGPHMHAFILGYDWPAEMQGIVWSRVIITESADYQAHHFEAQARAMHDLKARLLPMLREAPMLWMEL